MIPFKKALLVLTAAVLFAPVSAQGGTRSPVSPEEVPIYYEFHAKALGVSSDPVVARFEIRGDRRVLTSEKRLIQFGGATVLRVPIPTSLWAYTLDPHVEDLQLLIFADDLLVEVLDRDSLGSGVAGLRPEWPEECDDDYDCDGVLTADDNCLRRPNPNQENCDGDSLGDACDLTNGVFQASGPEKTCMTDRDQHLVYFTFEHHVEQRFVDISSCGAPDQWSGWVRDDVDCLGGTDQVCCQGLGTSILAVGDSVALWCGANRDINFCH